MHELAVSKELIRLVLEQSKSPKEIIVELGTLTTYKSESLEFYFDALKKEHSSLAKTALSIQEVPGTIKCDECGKESVVEAAYLLICPLCDSMQTTIMKGKDFNLKQIIE